MTKFTEQYRRHLPHIVPLHGTYHVTFRVKGSIPSAKADQLVKQFEQQKINLQSTPVIDKEYSNQLRELYTNYYEQFETILHKSKIKPLIDEKKANIVKNTLLFFNHQRYELICYSIMPNHVHVIFMDITKYLAKTMNSIKGYSAYEINNLDGKRGTFWQDENYDHLIESRNELADTITYILNNPVKSGLCNHYSKHPFTWCKEEFIEL